MTTNHQLQSPTLNNDEIDLRQLVATLGRHKILIGVVTISAALLSSLYAFTRKPVWEGSFQIVLRE